MLRVMPMKKFSEQEMEDVITANPDKYLEEGLKLIARQYRMGSYIFDLMFEDRHGAKLLVELQKGTLDRNHTYKILDYFDEYKTKHPNEFLELMVIANKIPRERRNRLSSMGISFKEIPESVILADIKQSSINKEEKLQKEAPNEQPIHNAKKPIKDVSGGEKDTDFLLYETGHSLKNILEQSSPHVSLLFQQFHNEIRKFSDEVFAKGYNQIWARTHKYGLSYFASEKKAFIFLNVRKSFISLILYTGGQEIHGVVAGNWITGDDKKGGKIQINDDQDILNAVTAAKAAYFIAAND